MAFINVVMDREMSYGFEGGPEWKTQIVDLENGLQDRDASWKFPKCRYSAAFANVPDEMRDYIIQVLQAVRGQLHSFKILDWNDYKIENQPIQVGAVGTTEKIQLYKSYTFGPARTIRPIQAVDPATCSIVGPSGNVSGTFDSETGEFVPATPWVAGTHTLSCEFFVWVHFTDDYNGLTINGWQNYTADLKLEEDKRKITATNLPLSWQP